MVTERAVREIRLRLRAMVKRRGIDPAREARLRKALREIEIARGWPAMRAAVRRALQVMVDGSKWQSD
jgi:hypothetical protein